MVLSGRLIVHAPVYPSEHRYLDAREVAALCKAMGKKLSKEGLQAAMQEMDGDGSGEVDFEEFERWYRSPLCTVCFHIIRNLETMHD